MSVHYIGVVLVRLFCVYLAITAVQSLTYVIPGVIQFGYRGGDLQELLTSPTTWLMLTGILLPAICAVGLWLKADYVLPAEAADDGPGAQASDIMLTGLSLLGLYLMISALIELVRVETAVAAVDQLGPATTTSQRLPIIAQLAFALALLLGRGRISTLLLKARRIGTETRGE